MKANHLFFIALIAVVKCTSCGKEGSVGPAGPKGDTGDTGAQGPQGPAGSANVIYSDWLSFDLASGVYAYVYYYKISAPKITQDILDHGIVLFYVKGGNSIYQIPNPYFNGLYIRISVGSIEVFSPTDWDSYSGYTYRYVIVPGGEAARVGSRPDYNNYQEVCQFYDMPE